MVGVRGGGRVLRADLAPFDARPGWGPRSRSAVGAEEGVLRVLRCFVPLVVSFVLVGLSSAARAELSASGPATFEESSPRYVADFSTGSEKGIGLSYRQAAGPYWVEAWLPGSPKKAPQRSGNRYRYSFAGHDFEYTVDWDEVHKQIHIPSRPASESFRFRIEWHEDLTTRERNGGYEFLDPAAT